MCDRGWFGFGLVSFGLIWFGLVWFVGSGILVWFARFVFWLFDVVWCGLVWLELKGLSVSVPRPPAAQSAGTSSTKVYPDGSIIYKPGDEERRAKKHLLHPRIATAVRDYHAAIHLLTNVKGQVPKTGIPVHIEPKTST